MKYLIKKIPTLSLKGLLRKFFNILIRSLLMGVLVFIFYNLLLDNFNSTNKFNELFNNSFINIIWDFSYFLLCKNIEEQKNNFKINYFSN